MLYSALNRLIKKNEGMKHKHLAFCTHIRYVKSEELPISLKDVKSGEYLGFARDYPLNKIIWQYMGVK
jgi:hypothetical protein